MNVTADQLLIFFAVSAALLAGYNVFMTAWKNHREAAQLKNAPTMNIKTQLEKHQQMLDTDKRRIDRLESDVGEVRDGQRCMMRGIKTLLDHELHNGNADKMQEASESIDEYLLNK